MEEWKGWGESGAERYISSGRSLWSLRVDGGKGLDEYLSKQLSGMKKRLSQEGEETHVSDW